MGPIRRTLEFLRRRKSAYQGTFTRNPAAMEVLADLAKFCRAGSTTFHDDPRVHAALEGRREVWLRITQHLHLTSEQLYALYSGKPFDPLLLDKEDKDLNNG